MDAFIERLAPQTVAATFWVDPPVGVTPSDRLVLSIAGRLRGCAARPGDVDRFTHDETVEGLVGGCGPVAVTARVRSVAEGDWDITARASFQPSLPGQGSASFARLVPYRARWSWLRWSAKRASAAPVHTCPLPLAMAPGTVVGAWAGLAVAGFVLAVLAQHWVASARHAHLPGLWAVSLGAIVGGLVGAKLWYMVVHRAERRRDGWCIQGLVAGVTVVGVALVGLTGLRVGAFLEVTSPGLLFGMAVGRLGCFVGGCCYGRLTSSRWGVWSSDRWIGARRIPTQLLESLLAASVGAAALAAVLSEGTLRGGVFVAALGGYIVIRQRLLRWRAEPRQSSWLTLAASVGAMILLAAGTAIAAT